MSGENENNLDLDRQDENLANQANESITDESNAKSESTDSSAEGKKDGEEKINQEAVEKKINKMYFEKMEAQREKERLEKEKADLQRQLDETKQQELPPIPDMPDLLDPEKDAKIAERDRILKLHAQKELQDKMAKQSSEEKIQSAFQARQRELQEKKTAFQKKGAEVNIDEASLSQAEALFVQMNPGKFQLAEYLLTSETGPMDVIFLSKNPAEMDKISKMSDIQAAMYIEKNISSKHEKVLPKNETDAPDPMTVPEGGAGSEDDGKTYNPLRGAKIY